MNLKNFWIRYSSGVSLGLIISGITVLALNDFVHTTGRVLALFGTIVYGIAEAFRD